MAITFPSSPIVGASIYYSGRQWTWDGTSWNLTLGAGTQYRWSKTVAATGTTVLSGNSDGGLNLGYTIGSEQVYLNGVLMVRNSDYTATTGSSITFLAGLQLGDVVDLISFTAFQMTDAIKQSNILNTGDMVLGKTQAVVGVLPIGTVNQKLVVDPTANLGVSWQEDDITPLDSLALKFDGIESRFLPTYGGDTLTISNPMRILMTVNGILQTVNFPEYVWQSYMPWDGFMVDSDGYLSFSEVPPAGSTFDARVMAGPVTNTKTTAYPFKAADILLGA